MNFTLTYNKETEDFYVPGLGKHQVYNALQSIAALSELGIGFNQIKEALKTFMKLPLRLQIKKGLNNCILLDDSWNVTTTSLTAALNTLNEISQGKKKVVLLGEIHRTGEYTKEITEKYVELFIKYGIDIDTLITIGHTGTLIINGLRKQDFKGNLYNFPNHEGIYKLLSEVLNAETVFLLKVTIEDYTEFINSLIIRLESCIKLKG